MTPSSQFPLIAGRSGGKVLRCAPDTFPIFEELKKSASKGNHWARRALKELSAASSGRLARFKGRLAAGVGGSRRHWLSLPGMSFAVDRYPNDLHVLSKVVFPFGESLYAAQKALRANQSRAVEPATATSFSKRGEEFLKRIETLRLLPYDDQTGLEITQWVEGATIGYGHLIPKMEWSLFKGGINESQADSLFNGDIKPFINAVNRYVDTPLSQQQFDALVLLAFNIGVAGFSSSSAVALINDPNATTPYNTLEDAWKAWRISQGKVNRGLVNRRAAEWLIFTQGVYQHW